MAKITQKNCQEPQGFSQNVVFFRDFGKTAIEAPFHYIFINIQNATMRDVTMHLLYMHHYAPLQVTLNVTYYIIHTSHVYQECARQQDFLNFYYCRSFHTMHSEDFFLAKILRR